MTVDIQLHCPGVAEGLSNFAVLIVALPAISTGLVLGLLLQATMHYAGLSPDTRVAVEVFTISLGTMLLLVSNQFVHSVKAETLVLLLSLPAVGFFSMIAGVATKIVLELAKRIVIL